MRLPKLPRKLKKKVYGKRGRRKHLALSILENKKAMELITNVFKLPNYENLESLLSRKI